MDKESLYRIFFEEAQEYITEIEQSLLQLEDTPGDMELIHTLFRAVHTLKGSSGMIGLSEIMNFTHTFESLLDMVRNEEIEVTDKVIALCLEATDHVIALKNFYQQNTEGSLPEDIKANGISLLEKMLEVVEGSKKEEPKKENEEHQEKEVPGETLQKKSPGTVTEEDITGRKEQREQRLVQNKHWHISLRCMKDLFGYGLDPYNFISELKKNGTIVSLVTVTDGIPVMEFFDPEKCYLGFEIEYDTEQNKAEIMKNFEFLEEHAHIRVLPPFSQISAYVSLIESLDEPPERVGEILISSGALTEEELEKSLQLQDLQKEKEHIPIGEIVVDEKMVQQNIVDAALKKQQESRTVKEKERRLMRIDVGKIDTLIRLVGELVITSANMRQLSSKSTDRQLEESATEVMRLVDEVRDSTMNIRMVPIGETFISFKRTVRDLSKEMGKKVELVIHGGETELDKTLVEKIHDPLMHLIRNAIDHGLESTEDRIAKGKPEQGTITLNAYYESGSVVIEMSDDGKGLRREEILRHAYERGIVSEDSMLSDEEVWALIFAPGFSTAREISSISGRGVGMDVVKRNIESLRGMTDIETERDRGMTIRMHLPLTLAIIDGFLIQVGENYYILPLDMVLECIDLSQEMDVTKEGGNFINIRGEVIPFVKLHELFRDKHDRPKRENIVIVEYARKRAGIVVDRLLGEFQTVIKPLGRLFRNLKWISGATILGNGEIALILDVPRLTEFIQQKSAVKNTQG